MTRRSGAAGREREARESRRFCIPVRTTGLLLPSVTPSKAAAVRAWARGSLRLGETGVVLVVDDDEAIRDVVRDALEFDGYRVVTAVDGAAGLTALQHLEPCVVLLDMRMPHVDGWEFSRRYGVQGHRAPIVVMTAAESAERWRAEIGGDACLPKPFELEQLYVVVGRFCGASA